MPRVPPVRSDANRMRDGRIADARARSCIGPFSFGHHPSTPNRHARHTPNAAPAEPLRDVDVTSASMARERALIPPALAARALRLGSAPLCHYRFLPPHHIVTARAHTRPTLHPHMIQGALPCSPHCPSPPHLPATLDSPLRRSVHRALTGRRRKRRAHSGRVAAKGRPRWPPSRRAATAAAS